MKYALKLVFLKCIFEFMINTALPASNSVHDKINFANHVCHCGAVVREFLARSDKLGSTPGDAALCFLVPFFSLFRLFFLNAIFPFGPFFLYSFCRPCCMLLVMRLDQYIFYFKLKSGVLFWKKGFQKLLICILAKLTTG